MKGFRLLLAVFALLPALSRAQSAPLVVSTEWLAAHLNDSTVIVIQAGGRAPAAGTERIPGTRWVGYNAFAPASELPTPDSLRSLFASVGVSDDSHIVLVGQPLSVTRAFYSIDYMGHPRVSVLDGGFTKWKREGRPVEASTHPPKRGQLNARPLRVDAVVSTDWVVSRVGKPGIALFDTRTENEYIGAEGSNGHIDGARFIDYRQYFTNAADFELVDRPTLEKLWADRAAPGDTVVAYCAVGYRASATYFVSRLLGVPVTLYDGSYDAWAKRKLPVVTAATPLRTGEGMKNTGGTLPAVSPDGRYVAFIAVRDGKQSDTYVIRADGSGERRLSRTAEWEERPSWIGDRVFSAVRAGDSVRTSTLDAVGARTIAGATLPGREARPSPNGDRVLVLAGEPMPVLQIWSGRGKTPRAASDTSKPPPMNADWSPDGTRIAYTTFDIEATRTLQIGVMNADGSEAHFITKFSAAEGRPQRPMWSSDGRRIAFHLEREASNQAFIYVVDVATGTVTKLAPHDAAYRDQAPSWFPDGKRIVFQSDRSGTIQLWVMNADGTGARQLTSYNGR